MTHLKIELNNGITEQVSPSVILKLYEIVHSGNLDSSSNLMGSLNTTGTYLSYVDYLEGQFTKNGVRLLIITATKLYMAFADSIVANYWATSAYGDGNGIDSTSAATVSKIPQNAFKNNTNVLSFNELSRFINCVKIEASAFEGCTSLTSIDTSNITTLGNYAFKGCTSLTSVYLSSLSGTQFAAFLNCTGLQCVDLTGFTTFGDSMFNGCSSLVDLTTSDISNINTGVETCTFNWTTVSTGCFTNASFANKSFNLPEVTEIKQDGFSNTKLVSVNASKIVTLGSWAFSGCTNLLSVTFGNYITSLGSLAFENCTALTTVTFGANSSFSLGSSFLGCSNLTTITNIANCNELGTGTFKNCTSLGVNETLELNLTNQTGNPENAFYGTKYKGLILHWPNYFTSSYRANYPLWELMNELEYLDISDTHWSQNATNVFSFYGSKKIKTVIFSPDTNQIALPNMSDERPLFLHLIILSNSVITIELQNKQDRMFRSDYAPQLNIYVPDSLLSSYLADATWSQISNISTHLKGLSELPAGVWTTGLASLYLTPALLATS